MRTPGASVDSMPQLWSFRTARGAGAAAALSSPRRTALPPGSAHRSPGNASAARGIGRATVDALTAGWQVVADVRDPDGIEESSDSISAVQHLLEPPGDFTFTDERAIELTGLPGRHTLFRVAVSTSSTPWDDDRQPASKGHS